MIRTLLAAVALLIAANHSFPRPAWSDSPMPIVRGEVLVDDQSLSDPSRWKVEQMPGGSVTIGNGRLEIDDAKGCTVWLRQRLSAPVLIEFEATMIDADGPNDNVRDLNCFWMAIDPKSPRDLFADTTRGGRFANYHPLRLYYVGYGGHKNKKTRFRRYLGTGERPLLPEHDLSDPNVLLPTNEPVRIVIICQDNRTQYVRNGDVIFDLTDPQPYQSGWFGFRTVSNHMTVNRFRVTKLMP